MLSNVSWEQFLTGVSLLLLVYYAVIGYRYFRKDIHIFLSGKLHKRSEGVINDPESSVSHPDSFEELEAIVADLRYAVIERAGKQISKENLLEQLNLRLTGYQGLQKPAFRLAINNAIIVHAKDICGVVLSEYELNSVWDTLPR